MFICLVVRLCFLFAEAVSEAKISPFVWVLGDFLNNVRDVQFFKLYSLVTIQEPYLYGGKLWGEEKYMIWSQFLSEPVSLGCVLQKCFSFFLDFPPPLSKAGNTKAGWVFLPLSQRLECSGVRIFFFPARSIRLLWNPS